MQQLYGFLIIAKALCDPPTRAYVLAVLVLAAIVPNPEDALRQAVLLLDILWISAGVYSICYCGLPSDNLQLFANAGSLVKTAMNSRAATSLFFAWHDIIKLQSARNHSI
jgi:hypothetical protein